ASAGAGAGAAPRHDLPDPLQEAPAPAPLPEYAPPAWWWASESFVRPPQPVAPADDATPLPAAQGWQAPPTLGLQQPRTAMPDLLGRPGRTAPGGPPAEPVPAPPADGLVRRVPGTHLAPSLRRGAPDQPPATPGPAPGRDREQVRSMLSRFQTSQRAGRAAAESPPEAPQEPR
ncbi:MAG TPA: hypothetical protein VFI47_30610, partial [Acidimicrobiales bacterium]|nr:hypothetical protein [Acidimicrobiales bacterium]